MNTYSVKMKDGECWYGLSAEHGYSFPLHENSDFSADYTINRTSNQVAPILISNKGRYIYSDTCFKIEVHGGEISISTDDVIELIEAGNTLKTAFLSAVENHFKPERGTPPREFFETPQYNTRIELGKNQSQAGILGYAHALSDGGYPAGIITIDDGWQKDFGIFEFIPEKFPDPKAMIDELHSMGFKVMLWTSPYVSPESPEFSELCEKNYFTRTADGNVSMHKWWNEVSASVDFSNPMAAFWFNTKLSYLMREYGVDGFKFDGGDARFYENDTISFSDISINCFTELWAKFGINHKYNEYRACVGCQGYPLVQRLSDKLHEWDERGMAALIPCSLNQGIMGYAYTCPDMIGGGEINSFNGKEKLDEELFVRYAQCAALMPMMQFSALPERVLSEENALYCLRAARLHIQYGHYIISLAENASKTGDPIIRYMEYEFPCQGFEKITDQFMLGDRILVAPVTKKGVTSREVKLPEGRWAYLGEKIYGGGATVTVDAPLSILPFFEKR